MNSSCWSNGIQPKTQFFSQCFNNLNSSMENIINTALDNFQFSQRGHRQQEPRYSLQKLGWARLWMVHFEGLLSVFIFLKNLLAAYLYCHSLYPFLSPFLLAFYAFHFIYICLHFYSTIYGRVKAYEYSKFSGGHVRNFRARVVNFLNKWT
jgi:hypothetical protein